MEENNIQNNLIDENSQLNNKNNNNFYQANKPKPKTVSTKLLVGTIVLIFITIIIALSTYFGLRRKDSYDTWSTGIDPSQSRYDSEYGGIIHLNINIGTEKNSVSSNKNSNEWRLHEMLKNSWFSFYINNEQDTLYKVQALNDTKLTWTVLTDDSIYARTNNIPVAIYNEKTHKKVSDVNFESQINFLNNQPIKYESQYEWWIFLKIPQQFPNPINSIQWPTNPINLGDIEVLAIYKKL